ncbi:MAG: lmo0937 family membrane protein [Bryobacteraceae bacterium]
MHLKRTSIFLILFFVLIIGWLLAWVAFHVAGALIHLLLLIAVIALVLHFISGGRRSA